MFSRTTRILLLIAVVAVTAFVLVELPRRRAQERAAEASAQLLDFAPSRVDGVRIDRSDDTLVFAIRGTHWQMLQPASDVAEYSRIASLLQAFSTARVERVLGPATDAHRFGLDTPVALTLYAGADTLAHIELGSMTVDRAYLYARRPDGNVVLAPTDLIDTLNLPAGDYRNQRVITFDLSVVRALHLRTPAGVSRWSRVPGGTGWFTVVAGDTIAGDSIAVDAVLRTMRGLRVADFVAPSDTAAAMNPPDVVATIVKAAPAPSVTIRFRCPHSAPCAASLSSERRVVTVNADIDRILAACVATLRERHVLHFAPERTTRIEIDLPDTSAVLVRSGGTWALPNPKLGAIDVEAARNVVRALRALSWVRMAGAGTPPQRPGDPTFSLVLRAGDGTILDEARGTIRDAGGVAVGTARRSGLRTEIEPKALHELAVRLRRLRVPVAQP